MSSAYLYNGPYAEQSLPKLSLQSIRFHDNQQVSSSDLSNVSRVSEIRDEESNRAIAPTSWATRGRVVQAPIGVASLPLMAEGLIPGDLIVYGNNPMLQPYEGSSTQGTYRFSLYTGTEGIQVVVGGKTVRIWDASGFRSIQTPVQSQNAPAFFFVYMEVWREAIGKNKFPSTSRDLPHHGDEDSTTIEPYLNPPLDYSDVVQARYRIKVAPLGDLGFFNAGTCIDAVLPGALPVEGDPSLWRVNMAGTTPYMGNHYFVTPIAVIQAPQPSLVGFLAGGGVANRDPMGRYAYRLYAESIRDLRPCRGSLFEAAQATLYSVVNGTYRRAEALIPTQFGGLNPIRGYGRSLYTIDGVKFTEQSKSLHLSKGQVVVGPFLAEYDVDPGGTCTVLFEDLEEATNLDLVEISQDLIETTVVLEEVAGDWVVQTTEPTIQWIPEGFVAEDLGSGTRKLMVGYRALSVSSGLPGFSMEADQVLSIDSKIGVESAGVRKLVRFPAEGQKCLASYVDPSPLPSIYPRVGTPSAEAEVRSLGPRGLGDTTAGVYLEVVRTAVTVTGGVFNIPGVFTEGLIGFEFLGLSEVYRSLATAPQSKAEYNEPVEFSTSTRTIDGGLSVAVALADGQYNIMVVAAVKAPVIRCSASGIDSFLEVIELEYQPAITPGLWELVDSAPLGSSPSVVAFLRDAQGRTLYEKEVAGSFLYGSLPRGAGLFEEYDQYPLSEVGPLDGGITVSDLPTGLRVPSKVSYSGSLFSGTFKVYALVPRNPLEAEVMNISEGGTTLFNCEVSGYRPVRGVTLSGEGFRTLFPLATLTLGSDASTSRMEMVGFTSVLEDTAEEGESILTVAPEPSPDLVYVEGSWIEGLVPSMDKVQTIEREGLDVLVGLVSIGGLFKLRPGDHIVAGATVYEHRNTPTSVLDDIVDDLDTNPATYSSGSWSSSSGGFVEVGDVFSISSGALGNPLDSEVTVLEVLSPSAALESLVEISGVTYMVPAGSSIYRVLNRSGRSLQVEIAIVKASYIKKRLDLSVAHRLPAPTGASLYGGPSVQETTGFIPTYGSGLTLAVGSEAASEGRGLLGARVLVPGRRPASLVAGTAKVVKGLGRVRVAHAMVVYSYTAGKPLLAIACTDTLTQPDGSASVGPQNSATTAIDFFELDSNVVVR